MNSFVTLILPIRNEAEYITRALQSVLAQDYPSQLMELLIVDGQSTDGTPQIIEAFLKDSDCQLPVRLFNNPSKIVPNGMNIAMRQARGEVMIRVDGHCIIAPDYVRKCVEHIQTDGVGAVGGPMKTVGESYIARVTAIGMSSSFGVGNSAFRTVEGQSMWVDTVPFPAYTREVIERAGLYDEELVRNQDDEYNYRIRELGGKILLAEDIRSTYFSRTSLGRVWKQYFQYGFWKIRVLQKHPLQMSPRQFAPPALVLGLILSALLPLSSFFFPLSPALGPLSLIIPSLYLFANLAASVITSARKGWKYLPLLPLAFAILHLSYGLGFLVGLFRFAHRWGDRTGRVPDWSPGRQPRIEPLPTSPVRSHPLAISARLSSTGPLVARPPELGSAAGDGQD